MSSLVQSRRAAMLSMPAAAGVLMSVKPAFAAGGAPADGYYENTEALLKIMDGLIVGFKSGPVPDEDYANFKAKTNLWLEAYLDYHDGQRRSFDSAYKAAQLIATRNPPKGGPKASAAALISDSRKALEIRSPCEAVKSCGL